MPKISLFSLVMLVVAAIDSIRNLPATALFGSSLIFFFLLSALFFLIPVSLVSAEFSSRFPNQGGVFHWVRHAFGEKIGMLAIWLQWINTMVWYPTILSFIAGTGAYLINPQLAENKLFLSLSILIVFWALTLINLKGIQVSVRICSFCGMIGALFPMGLLILLGCFWVIMGNPIAISFQPEFLIPSFGESSNWTALIAIMASFLGMELAGVHANDIENPQKNFPKAMGLSVLILVSTMLLGALSIAVVVPQKTIHLVDGIMQTFTIFFESFHIPFFVPLLAVLIMIGSIGGMINWLVSPAKGLLQAAEFGFLPKYFLKKNGQGVASRILIAQAVIVSFFCLAFVFLPSINAFYWFLTALSTELYMIMYVLLFLAAIKLGRPRKDPQHFQMPMGTRRFFCFLGFVACLITIFVSFASPEGIQVGSAFRYALLIAIGNVITILPVYFLCYFQRKNFSKLK